MSNANHITVGHLDRICGIDHLTAISGKSVLDQFSAVARNIEAIDQEEALAQAQESYADMWELSVRLAARVSALRALGTRNSREARVLEILDCAVKALESEGLGI